MKLYYTTIVQPGNAQRDPLFSLGGFISSNVVPNGALGSLFSDTSVLSGQQGSSSYIGLILKNTLSVPATGIEVYGVLENASYSDILFSAVQLTEEGEMEHIDNPSSAPYYADFVNIIGEENKVGIGDLQPDQGIGIWLCRKTDREKYLQSTTDDALYEKYLQGLTCTPKDSKFQLTITWT